MARIDELGARLEMQRGWRGQAGRAARSQHMIAAEGLAAVGRMIAASLRRPDYEIAWSPTSPQTPRAGVGRMPTSTPATAGTPGSRTRSAPGKRPGSASGLRLMRRQAVTNRVAADLAPGPGWACTTAATSRTPGAAEPVPARCPPEHSGRRPCPANRETKYPRHKPGTTGVSSRPRPNPNHQTNSSKVNRSRGRESALKFLVSRSRLPGV